MTSIVSTQFQQCSETYVEKEQSLLRLNDRNSDKASNLLRLANFNIALAMIYFLGEHAVKSSESSQEIYLRTEGRRTSRNDEGERQFRLTLTNVSLGNDELNNVEPTLAFSLLTTPKGYKIIHGICNIGQVDHESTDDLITRFPDLFSSIANRLGVSTDFDSFCKALQVAVGAQQSYLHLRLVH